MKLGAQLYSLNKFVKTPEELKATMLKCKEIGYENVQFSSVPNMGAEVWKKISDETGMEIVCTHSPFDRIINDTDALIEEHKIFGCPVIGLGWMPNEYHDSWENFSKCLPLFEAAVAKIEAAGLHFGYHNHAFEFDKFTDADFCMMDYIIDKLPEWYIILDTGWVKFAGADQVALIERIGGRRLQCIHFKEFKSADKTDLFNNICTCGEGFSDFASIVAACKKVGVENVLVEQDNASDKEDPFGEMKKSYDHLAPMFKD